MIGINAEYHQALDDVFLPHGEVLHGNMKEYSRAVAKIKRDYLDGSVRKPESGSLKDILRGTLLVDDHNRLADGLRAMHSRYFCFMDSTHFNTASTFFFNGPKKRLVTCVLCFQVHRGVRKGPPLRRHA